MIKKPVFESFAEYWYYARYLSKEQRKTIFKSLKTEQKKFLEKSFNKDGWSDLFNRNEIHERIDELYKVYGYNLLEIKLKLLKGKSVYLPTKFWKVVEEQLGEYSPESIGFIMCGLEAIPCEENKEVCLLQYNPTKT